MAERRKRINLYMGPRERIERDQLPGYEASGKWVAEVKHDGVWALATFVDGTIISLTSRTGQPLAAPALLGKKVVDKGEGQLAGELVADTVDGERSGTRRLHLFEPLMWNGLDLRTLMLEERREALEMIFDTFDDEFAYQGLGPATNFVMHLVERREKYFQKWYDELVKSKAEGLVLKKKGMTARPSNADGKVDHWLRCKPLNTVDYVVIGPDGTAEKGTPKIAIGLYKQTKDGRRVVKVMSPTWPKGMVLKAGDVVEVEGAEVWPSGAVRHGYIKRVRSDKRATDCTYEAAVR